MSGIISTSGAKTRLIGKTKNDKLTSPTLTTPALGTVASGNFDTVMPYSSRAINVGTLRIVCGSNTTGGSASLYEAASSAASSMHRYYNLVTATYTGFSDTPTVFSGTANGPYHQMSSSTGRTAQSSTATSWYLISAYSNQTETSTIEWVAIGTKS